VYQKERVGVF